MSDFPEKSGGISEERQGHMRLYPHTEQLPGLLRFVHRDFHSALLPKFETLDGRANDFDKIIIKHAALLYGSSMNAERPENLLFYPLPDRNLVTRPAIVQQITEELPFTTIHRFRFYGGKDLFPEIYCCGKRIAFTDNVFKKFAKIEDDADIATFLLVFYHSPTVSLPVDKGRGFVLEFGKSILAFPYTETDVEYLVNDCLTVNDIKELGLQLPPYSVNFHYDLPYIRPKIRNWLTFDHMKDMYERWEKKVQYAPRSTKGTQLKWIELGSQARDFKKKAGHGLKSKIVFLDRLPGPYTLEIGQTNYEPKLDEFDTFKKALPQYAWDKEIFDRENDGTLPKSVVDYRTAMTR